MKANLSVALTVEPCCRGIVPASYQLIGQVGVVEGDRQHAAGSANLTDLVTPEMSSAICNQGLCETKSSNEVKAVKDFEHTLAVQIFMQFLLGPVQDQTRYGLHWTRGRFSRKIKLWN